MSPLLGRMQSALNYVIPGLKVIIVDKISHADPGGEHRSLSTENPFFPPQHYSGTPIDL